MMALFKLSTLNCKGLIGGNKINLLAQYIINSKIDVMFSQVTYR
jgi:hypothetical protein